MAAVNPTVAAARDTRALLDEEWPTGTYGDSRPGPCPHPDQDAAAHRQALLKGMRGWRCGTTTELRDRATGEGP
ncbi:hypothetical protein ACFW6X_15835 [Streptomyces bacillaris]|uniref:hypothetical protein n=1 Tax=Streptomyces bacillaris TaxID=68179 RepID=UPI0036A7E4F9